MQAISQIPISIPFQSYHDFSLEEKALLIQATNDLIVSSTKRTYQGKGYAVGLAGFSDTPVALRFYGSEKDSGVVFCRPGQVIRIGKFEAFDYGCPFGWLGGGNAILYIAHTPETEFDLGISKPELIFHRLTIVVEDVSGGLPTLKRNWPLRFPWTQAVRGADSADQRGTPILRVEPSRALMRLNISYVVPKTVCLIARNTAEFGTTPSDHVFTEVTFPAATVPSGQSFATIPEDFLRLDCSEGGLTIHDNGDPDLTGADISIARFGRI